MLTGILIGLFVGGSLGVVVMAIVAAGAREDEHMQELYQRDLERYFDR